MRKVHDGERGSGAVEMQINECSNEYPVDA